MRNFGQIEEGSSPDDVQAPVPNQIVKVTVAGKTGGGNAYFFGGVERDSLETLRGTTITFDTTDSTNNDHPFKLSSTNADSSSGTEYTDGVAYYINGSVVDGSDYVSNYSTGATSGLRGVMWTVPDQVSTIYYYCTAHDGMGETGRLTSTNDVQAPVPVTTDKLPPIKTIVPQVSGCYEAYLPNFKTCSNYEDCGYTCVGQYCAYSGSTCRCDCNECAVFHPGKVASTATGRCVYRTPVEVLYESLFVDLMNAESSPNSAKAIVPNDVMTPPGIFDVGIDVVQPCTQRQKCDFEAADAGAHSKHKNLMSIFFGIGGVLLVIFALVFVMSQE